MSWIRKVEPEGRKDAVRRKMVMGLVFQVRMEMSMVDADVEGAEDGVVTMMLLRPKVVLDTIVYELGLVDEEDASPSTAEPSASA